MGADSKDINGEGDHDSEEIYGKMLRLGLGVEKNLEEAKKYLYRATLYYTPMAPYEYALCLEEEKRYQEAIWWLTRAAERHVTNAAVRLGEYYRDGREGVAVDLYKAKK